MSPCIRGVRDIDMVLLVLRGGRDDGPRPARLVPHDHQQRVFLHRSGQRRRAGPAQGEGFLPAILQRGGGRHGVWSPTIIVSSQNGYQGKTRSLVGDAKFETMVRRDTRKNLLMENSAVEKEEEEEDESAKEDEVFLLESLQDEPANSKVSLASALVLHVHPGEADDPDQADGLDQRPGPGGQDGGGGGRAPHPHGDQGAQAGLGQ